LTVAVDELLDNPDAAVRKWLQAGFRPVQVNTLPDGGRAIGWDIHDYIATRGRAPELPSVAETPLAAFAGSPWRTPNNIAFIIVSGKAQGQAIEISRDLLAPAKLAARELGTLAGSDIRERIWYNNMIENRPYIESGECIQRNRFKGRPVIIAGAGPSLEKQVDMINECNVPVIMTNRAVKVLKPKQGFYMSIDFKGETAWYGDIDVENIEAIFDTVTAARSVVQPWKRRRWFRQTYATGLANKTSAEWYPRLPLLDPGHCVAYAALGLALWWGADPIILVGQDFSFGTNMTMHAGEGPNSVVSNHDPRPVQDIYGGMTITDKLFFGAARHVMASIMLSSVYGGMWSRHVPRFINCTEGGILAIPNIAPLAETLERCETDLPSVQGTSVPAYTFKPRANKAKRRARGGAPAGYAMRLLDPKLRRAVCKPDSYWSTEYYGPKNPDKLDPGVVFVKHPGTGREMMMSKDVYERLVAEGKAPDVAE